jgi:hypothetical protein
MTNAPPVSFPGSGEKCGKKPDRLRRIGNQNVRLDRWLRRADRTGSGGDSTHNMRLVEATLESVPVCRRQSPPMAKQHH